MKDRRTGRVGRARAWKKMTVEMVTGVEGQGPFVWPEVEKEAKEPGQARASGKGREEAKKRMNRQEAHKLDPEDAGSLKERARLLLQGERRWRPSWEEHGGAAAVAMGRQVRDGS